MIFLIVGGSKDDDSGLRGLGFLSSLLERDLEIDVNRVRQIDGLGRGLKNSGIDAKLMLFSSKHETTPEDIIILFLYLMILVIMLLLELLLQRRLRKLRELRKLRRRRLLHHGKLLGNQFLLTKRDKLKGLLGRRR